MIKNKYLIEEFKKIGFNVDSEFFTENYAKIDDMNIIDDMLYESNYFEKIYFINKGYNTDFGKVECKDNNFEYSVGKVSLKYVLKLLSLFLNEDNYMPLLFDYFRPIRFKFNTEYLTDKSREGIKNIFKIGIKDIISKEIDSRRFNKNSSKNYKLLNTSKTDSKDINIKIGENSSSENIDCSIIEIDENLPLNNIGELFDVATVKIKSNGLMSLEAFEKLSDSFVYSLSYNFSYSLVEIKSKKKLGLKNLDYINRGDKSQDKQIISTPKKLYNKKLIHYFQQALSTEDPILKFLSYYQCLEYFYLKIYKNKMIKKVKDTLSSPDSINFYDDYSDDKIEDIINYIQKEERRYTEEESLILVLDEFLDKSRLLSDLQNYWDIDFNSIFNNQVEFANAPSLNNTQEISTKTLASRIYKIRNSLVHSKEGKDNAYEPFNKDHEKELKQELLLIRLIAEQIIESSAEIIRRNDIQLGVYKEVFNKFKE